ncbi:MAG TPA: isoprenylcysteine carboxylmethyltransferase family protein [Anaerolineales bacterium]|nr:isoprenylcysteine carboxylmethyltransferase family protein [Anaerolineales bacterium]
MKSLRNPRSHGFYRFFAWEAILALFLINVKYWFYKPFAWNQIIAWPLLILCLIPLVFGVHTLRTRGKPAKRREGDSALLSFEKTTTLVTSGIYRYIRHPLYSSLFLLAWGIFFKSPSLLGTVLAVTATFFLVATAKADETECTHFFGVPYQEYMQKTKMFVPYIF